MPTGFIARAIPAFPARLAAGFMGAATVLAVVGLVLIGTSPIIALDEVARAAAQQIANDTLSTFFRAVTRFGSAQYLTIFGSAAVILFFLLRWYRASLLFLIASAGQIALHLGFKFLVGRGRPEPLVAYTIDDNYSFPSGHAIASLVVYLSVAWLVANRVAARISKIGILAVAVFIIAVIGVSRVYFGVHHFTDVFAGWVAGLIWTAVVISGDEP